MIEVLIECRNVTCEKMARILSNFSGTRENEFKVWLHDRKVLAYFKVANILELNEFTRRLKRKRTTFKYRSIKRHIFRARRWTDKNLS